MTYAALDDLALFEPAVLLPALVLPNNLLVMQEEAGKRGEGASMLALQRAWAHERADRSWDAVRADGPTYCWAPSICGPRPDPSRRTDCQAQVLSLDLRCDHLHRGCECVGELLYRHLCTCGHLDPARTGENHAAEDAMDHSWPGWRDLPILACSMPDERKQQARWLATANDAYPTQWLERGGPVRTARSTTGRRHVPGRTPYDGYDMGVAVAEQYLSHVYKPGLYTDKEHQQHP